MILLALSFLLQIGNPDTARLSTHWTFLSSDQLEGRATGSMGEKLAGDYLINQLKEYGLKPVPGLGFEQKIPMHSGKPLSTSRFSLYSGNDTIHLNLEDDYLLYTTGAQTFIPAPIPLVFVGYGIIAPEFDYNDYQLMDVEGKVVVYFSGEPSSQSAIYFDGDQPTQYSLPAVKHRMAISRGAAGTILIPDPDADYRDWEYWKRQFAFDDVIQSYSVTSGFSALLHPDKAGQLFSKSTFSLQETRKLEKNHRLTSFKLNTEMTFHGEFLSRDFIARNIIAVAGDTSRLAEKGALLVMSHYDHLGIGPVMQGDSIYNGAMDNAIGVAVTLEIARLLALEKNQTRPVIFLFTTGEEKGLLGSTYYTNFPVVPLNKTIAAVNIDGINFLAQCEDFLVVGYGLSDLDKPVEKILKKMGLSVSDGFPMYVNEESLLRSDHFTTIRAGIPTVAFIEGFEFPGIQPSVANRFRLHWDQFIYHSPFDDHHQYINWKAVHQHSTLLLEFIRYLASVETDYDWYRNTPYRSIRLRTKARNQ